MIDANSLDNAYACCRSQVASHYENFPVASWLLPKRLRNPVAAIYCFARTADDLADEGDLAPQARIDKLDEMGAVLGLIAEGKPQLQPMDIALADTIKTYFLPIQLFHDLLSAFKQDVTKKRYRNFSELMDYCRRSANPVGRLLLHLFKAQEPDDYARSDSICTALQLINFLQDIEQDYQENGRIYIPQTELKQFHVSEETIAKGISDPYMHQLLSYQIHQARNMLISGAPLSLHLPGRTGFELRMIVLGGLRILDKLAKQKHNLFSRPRLKTSDMLSISLNAVRKRFPA